MSKTVHFGSNGNRCAAAADDDGPPYVGLLWQLYEEAMAETIEEALEEEGGNQRAEEGGDGERKNRRWRRKGAISPPHPTTEEEQQEEAHDGKEGVKRRPHLSLQELLSEALTRSSAEEPTDVANDRIEPILPIPSASVRGSSSPPLTVAAPVKSPASTITTTTSNKTKTKSTATANRKAVVHNIMGAAAAADVGEETMLTTPTRVDEENALLLASYMLCLAKAVQKGRRSEINDNKMNCVTANTKQQTDDGSGLRRPPSPTMEGGVGEAEDPVAFSNYILAKWYSKIN